MKSYFLTFRSVTFAQRGEAIVSRNQYRCTLQRTPRWMEEQGCGYSLRVWARDIMPVVELLRREQIALRRVYVQLPDGGLEEVAV